MSKGFLELYVLKIIVSELSVKTKTGKLNA